MDSERIELNQEQIGQVNTEGFLRHTCGCGHELFVWTDRNESLKLRARCLRCKCDGSYFLVWSGLDKYLLRFKDTYQDWLNAYEVTEVLAWGS